MMLSEDPEVVVKRRELRDRKQRLELALQKIAELDPGNPPVASHIYEPSNSPLFLAHPLAPECK